MFLGRNCFVTDRNRWRFWLNRLIQFRYVDFLRLSYGRAAHFEEDQTRRSTSLQSIFLLVDG